MDRLAFVVVILLSLSVSSSSAFHRAGKSWRPTNNRKIPSSRQQQPSSSSTALWSSFKFKNVDEMLETFRDEPLLIAFTAKTCGPCKLQMKELASLGQKIGNSFRVIAIDTNKWPHIGSRFKVGKLPCLLVLKDGEIQFKFEGLTRADEVVERVRATLNTVKTQ